MSIKKSVLILAALLGLFSFSAIAAPLPKPHIILNSEGVIHVEPNLAVMQLRIETTEPTAEQAVRKNAKKMTALIAALQKEVGSTGIISTNNYKLSPIYEYDQETRKSLMRGYKASNQLQVSSEALSSVGDLVDLASELGATHIDKIAFENRALREYQQQALAAAIANGMEQAKVMAAAAKVKLGQLLSLSPTSVATPSPMVKSFAIAERQDSSTPIEAGEQEVRASVQLKIELIN